MLNTLKTEIETYAYPQIKRQYGLRR